MGLDRDRKFGGYVFEAFIPATGEVLTAAYEARPISMFADSLEKVEQWVPDDVGRIYAIVDNLRAHKAYDVLLFNTAHPRWEFVSQPKYAACLNLVEPPAEDQGARPRRPVLRALGADRRRDREGQELLERPPPPLRLGTARAVSAIPPAGRPREAHDTIPMSGR